MPHDTNGQLLNVGDEVVLRGKVKSIDSEQPTYCNITMQTEKGMAPEHDAEGYIISLSARMVEKQGGSNG